MLIPIVNLVETTLVPTPRGPQRARFAVPMVAQRLAALLDSLEAPSNQTAPGFPAPDQGSPLDWRFLYKDEMHRYVDGVDTLAAQYSFEDFRDAVILQIAGGDRISRDRPQILMYELGSPVVAILLLESEPDGGVNPERVEPKGISEPLGVYWPDVQKGSWVYEVLESTIAAFKRYACSDNETRKIPVIGLYVNQLVETAHGLHSEGVLPSNDECFEALMHSVLLHELGHHVFQLEAAGYSQYAAGDVKTRNRAEGFANTFAWLMGTPTERVVLEALSQSQSAPYRHYKNLLHGSRHTFQHQGALGLSGIAAMGFGYLGRWLGSALRTNAATHQDWAREVISFGMELDALSPKHRVDCEDLIRSSLLRAHALDVIQEIEDMMKTGDSNSRNGVNSDP